VSSKAFYKMTGSGNDFIFFDARSGQAKDFESPTSIAELAARGTGVGADGVVFLYNADGADIGIRYYNSDGSPASLCGNATLCTASLAGILGAVDPQGFTIATDAGIVRARIQGKLAEFDLPRVIDIKPKYDPIPVEPDEIRLGYVTASIPHVVIQVKDLDALDAIEIERRGPVVRHHPSLEFGANVNFVAQRPDGAWAIRTYERGVEGETLACGTGNVAAAILLKEWGLVPDSDQVVLYPKSGQPLTVTLCRDGDAWMPSLRGEGRLVFQGELVGP
jgi:diaminopimelate epimerase